MPVLQSHRRIGVTIPLGDDVLLLRRMTGSEALSTPFEYHLELLSEDSRLPLSEILAQPLVVRLETPAAGSRFFHGFVSRFAQSDVPYPGERFTAYRAVVRPWLWFLTRTADCRIFQQQTVPEIVKAVFQEHGFADFEDHLSGSYRTWDYCVQYRETDFNFISRLLEQEGIYYCFRHSDDRHVLVLCDDYSAHEPVAGYEKIPYYPPSHQERRARDHIFAWTLERQVQPGSYALTDYDPLIPRKNLFNTVTESRDHDQSSHEIFDYPGEFTEVADGKHYAQLRLDTLQAQHETVQGQGNACGLAVGALFELENYPRQDQNREHLVTAARWELASDAFQSGGGGGGETDFHCTFQALEAQRPFRPLQSTPKPVVQGPQTAMVVGKAGEEIWTDEHARIKVQFHWDRDGKADEHTSCWIRVAQVWAGKGWGGIHIPRIGQEVIVDFLEGDPDRPIVTGSVYNGVNKPPYPLPDQATLSGIKSNSSKGGGGFNELRFEDKKGEEQVFVHAEKNLDLRVKNDRFQTIGRDDHLHVLQDRYDRIDNDHHETVKRDHVEEIDRDHHRRVKGKEALRVDGVRSVTVKGNVVEVFKADHSEKTTGDLSISAENVVIEASTNITLKVGQSYIAIEAGGIKIGTTGSLELESTGQMTAKGSAGIKVESPATIDIKAPMTTVEASGILTLKGGLVKIN